VVAKQKNLRTADQVDN